MLFYFVQVLGTAKKKGEGGGGGGGGGEFLGWGYYKEQAGLACGYVGHERTRNLELQNPENVRY